MVLRTVNFKLLTRIALDGGVVAVVLSCIYAEKSGEFTPGGSERALTTSMHNFNQAIVCLNAPTI